MNEKLLVILGGAAIVGGLAYHLSNVVPPAHALAGEDTSSSVQSNCMGVRDATRAMLTNKPGIQQGSTLSTLLMGSDARHPQPTLVSHGDIPIPSDFVYGQDPEAFRKTEDAYFGKVQSTCQSARGGSGSPIYEMVRQGLAHLHSEGLGCGPKGRCYFLVKTDLDEDVETSLREVLQQAAKDPSDELPPQLIKSLDNKGIEIHFCGLAEVRARRGPAASLETRARIWKELFTDPQLVSFEPYCK